MRQCLPRFHDAHDSGFDGYGSVFLHSLHVVTLFKGGHGYTDFAHLAAVQDRYRVRVRGSAFFSSVESVAVVSCGVSAQYDT